MHEMFVLDLVRNRHRAPPIETETRGTGDALYMILNLQYSEYCTFVLRDSYLCNIDRFRTLARRCVPFSGEIARQNQEIGSFPVVFDPGYVCLWGNYLVMFARIRNRSRLLSRLIRHFPRSMSRENVTT